MSAFWASWTPCYIRWVRHVLTLALYFSNIWIKIPDGYQIARVWRNSACDQPVSCSCGSGVLTWRSELSFRCLYSEVIIFILIRCLICYMWDLTSWTHIWCVSGFVLKTGCDITAFKLCNIQLHKIKPNRTETTS